MIKSWCSTQTATAFHRKSHTHACSNIRHTNTRTHTRTHTHTYVNALTELIFWMHLLMLLGWEFGVYLQALLKQICMLVLPNTNTNILMCIGVCVVRSLLWQIQYSTAFPLSVQWTTPSSPSKRTRMHLRRIAAVTACHLSSPTAMSLRGLCAPRQRLKAVTPPPQH